MPMGDAKEEDWLLATIPDDAWNSLMAYDTIAAVRSLRRHGYDLKLAMLVIDKMKAMLGQPKTDTWLAR
jgi:hypothetical protein